MEDDITRIGIETYITGGGVQDAISSGERIQKAFNEAGAAADNFSLRVALANEKTANAMASLAKSTVTGKNSWYSPNATEAENWAAALQNAENTTAIEATNKALQKQEQSLITARYALYDLSSTYKTIGITGAAALTAMVKTAADYESAFINVQRTTDATGSQVTELYNNLIDLSREIPESFSNLSEIATLGGQFGIAKESIVGFTETVAQFTATTDASVDEAATGFARIAQHTKAGASAYESIGSAIYTVGVNSVATETGIMNIAQEIATTGNLAGFSTAEIIGLSGALASLGVQPERARGNVQRIFAELDEAVAEGGEKLQQFASVSNMSASDFATKWKTNAADTFVKLIEGLNRASDSGANLDMVIANLGITSVRDVQTLKQLADNTDLLHQTMSDASTSYSDATSLSEAYGMVSETLTSKLTMLKNSIQNILAELGESTILGKAVSDIQVITDAVGDALSALNSIGNASGVGNLVTMFTSGLIAMTLFKAGLLTLKATYAAVLTSQVNLQRAGASLNVSILEMIKTIATLGTTSKTTAESLNTLAAGEKTAAAATGTLSVAAKTGSAAIATLKSVAKSFLPFLAVSVGVEAASKALEWFQQKTESAKETAERLGISWSGLSDVLNTDKNTWIETGNAIAVYTTNTDGTSTSLTAMSSAAAAAAQQQLAVADSTNTATESLSNSIVVMGQATAAYVANQVLQSDGFKAIFQENKAALDAAGVSATSFAQKLTTLGTTQTLSWLKDQLQSVKTEMDNLDVDYNFNTGLDSNDMEEYTRLQMQIEALNELIDNTEPTFESLGVEMDYVAGIAGNTADGIAAVGDSSGDTGNDALTAAESLSQLADGLLSGTISAADFEAKMYDLGAAMANNGNDFSVYTEAGRANLAALQAAVSQAATNAAGDSAAFAASLKQILAALMSHGVDVANVFPQLLKQAQVKNVSELNDTLAKSYQNVSFQSGYAAQSAKNYASATKKAGNAAATAAKKVYTLSDYVSDLSSVMKDSFDFQWGYQESVDDAAESLQKLADYQKDAADDLADAKQKISDYRQEINKLKADLNGLYADKATLKYQLGVAIDYGDTLRAAEIQAELAKKQEDINDNLSDQQSKNKDIATSQGDVVDAQNRLNKNLDGTTKASRDQREMVLDLVESYQDQIIALANSGASQDEVKRKTQELQDKFYAQMKQLGYNRAEAEKYGKTFENIKNILNSIPRNITIKATAPDTRAIAEWRAKNTNGRGLSSPVNIGSRVKTPDIRGAQNWLNKHPLDIKTRLREVSSGKYVRIGGRVGVDFLMSAYASGGFTGRGGKYDPAGIIHKGEYVFPKNMVNQNTGLPTQAALAAMLAATSSSTTNITNNRLPSVLQVELSPTDRNLLAQANGPVQIVLSASEIASTVNRQNEISTTRGS